MEVSCIMKLIVTDLRLKTMAPSHLCIKKKARRISLNFKVVQNTLYLLKIEHS